MIDYARFLSRAGAGMQESAIRRMGTVSAANRDIISFAPGYPAPEMFPWDAFREVTRELLSGSDAHVLQYGPTRGLRPLLEVIEGIMSRRDAPTAIDRLLVTTGSQQGLDLVARVLLDPGDVVLVELPTYTGAITAFRNVQAHLVGVEQEADGIDLAALDAVHSRLVRAGRRVRLLYVVPNFQNPTGLLIGPGKRLKLLEWAASHDILIVEDDPYRELYFEDAAEAGLRPMKADDREGRVIYLSSFSKTLAPGFRVAWIDAPAALTTRFELAKQSADLCTGALDQRVVNEVARRGVLERQLPMLRQHYKEKRDVMAAALHAGFEGTVTWPDPHGGFFIWARLPAGIDASRLLDRAIRHGVIYVAGEAFFVGREGGVPEVATDTGGRSLVRLSFSAPTHARIAEGVRRLAAAVREELADLRLSGPAGSRPRPRQEVP
jgi:2-aminoadipate transaminase